MSDPRVLALRNMLQQALELELFTIPPYLTALYSIKDDRNLASSQIIQGVVMEEMLHVALVANVLNAVGGTPLISPDRADETSSGDRHLAVCHYPSRVPHVDIGPEVSLSKFEPATIETFSLIEAPEDPGLWAASGGQIGTIGQFYDLLLKRLVALSEDIGEEALFTGHPGRQVASDHYYGGGGNLVPVSGLADARDVIEIVSQQGEGRRHITNQTGDQLRFGQPKEVAHYYRFKQILAGRYYDRDEDVSGDPSGPCLFVDWAGVYPVLPNPSADVKSPTGICRLLRDFEETYRGLLDALHAGFNGEPEVLLSAVTAMHALKQRCVDLMRVGITDDGNSGPPFWFVKSNS